MSVHDARYPYLCECGQGIPPGHVCCSACGADWADCVCGAPDDEDVPWMLAELGHPPFPASARLEAS